MEFVRASLVEIILFSLCMAQAANKQHRTRLTMEVPSVSTSKKLRLELVPSLEPAALSQPSSSEINDSAIVASGTPSAVIQQSSAPFPFPPGFKDPCANISSPECRAIQTSISKDRVFGEVGVESDSFRRFCKNFCEKHSGRRCWLVKRPKIHPRCKQGQRLGKKDVPSCCFYLHCLRFRRPHGRSEMWWKHTKVLRLVRQACKK